MMFREIEFRNPRQDIEVVGTYEVLEFVENRHVDASSATSSIILMDSEWGAKVCIHMKGEGAQSIRGRWSMKFQLDAYIHAIGDKFETQVDLGDTNQPILPGTEYYETVIKFPPPREIVDPRSPYRLYVTVTCYDGDDKRTELVGTSVGETLQFYETQADPAAPTAGDRQEGAEERAIIKKVIAALDDPKHEWKTIEEVSKETGLATEVVDQAVKKLGDRVVESQIPNREGQPRYTTLSQLRRKASFRADTATDVFIEQLARAEPGDIQSIASSQIGLLNQYHNLALSQASQSFTWALVAAGIGLLFFIAAIGFLLITEIQSLATISLISGAVIEVISGINFYLYGQTTKQLAHYHQRLEQLQRFLLANSVCESLKGESQQTARMNLIATMTSLQHLGETG